VRDRNRDVRAFYNVCRHRGSQLVERETNCKVIRCPYHGWGYGLDGTLLGTPYFKGLDVPAELAEKFRMQTEVEETFCKEDYPLHSVSVRTWAGIIFVNLSPNPIEFSDWLGDLPQRFARHPLDDLKLARRQTFEIRANWKLIAENFTEYYHLPFGHPELCNVSGFDNHWRYQGPGMYTGMCTSPLTSDPSTVSFEMLPVWEGLTPTESQSAYFILLFPNIALWIFPHHLLTLLFFPQSECLTIEHLDMLVAPQILGDAAVGDGIDRIMAFWKFVNDQDIELVQRVQRGLAARAYAGGRMCFKFEEPVHRFQNMVADLMTGSVRIPPGDLKEEAPDLGLIQQT
jgi:phenylpropionate dioxygenase-like ring-hydroxylating dioxygenase large terminal subunit